MRRWSRQYNSLPIYNIFRVTTTALHDDVKWSVHPHWIDLIMWPREQNKRQVYVQCSTRARYTHISVYHSRILMGDHPRRRRRRWKICNRTRTLRELLNLGHFDFTTWQFAQFLCCFAAVGLRWVLLCMCAYVRIKYYYPHPCHHKTSFFWWHTHTHNNKPDDVLNIIWNMERYLRAYVLWITQRKWIIQRDFLRLFEFE